MQVAAQVDICLDDGAAGESDVGSAGYAGSTGDFVERILR